MKNNKNEKYGLLTENEMKSVKGGHTFTTTDIIPRCPACGEWIIRAYTYYLSFASRFMLYSSLYIVF